MLFLYRFVITIIYFISPIIILIRLIKKKEDIKRFKEKIGFFKKVKIKGDLIWFHGASVGELKSIIPLIEKFEKNKKIKHLLITSNTISSSEIFKKKKFKKVVHQFFPIDTNFLAKKFINYWKPSKVFFIDSEIWPNIILAIKEKKIPLILINGRITTKTYKRWNLLSNFSNKIFSSFDLNLTSDIKTFKYLHKLKSKNIKHFGNLKYIQPQSGLSIINSKFSGIFKKRLIWCAASTHEGEEVVCAKVHTKLKKKFNNLLTIIIPRHINRCKEIKNKLEKFNLKVQIANNHNNSIKNTDIYLVNSYGETNKFYSICKNVFLGGSLIKHGGQNPLEAARMGCNIISGKNIENFTEVYNFLEKNKISKKIYNSKELTSYLKKLLLKNSSNLAIKRKIRTLGQKILNRTYKEINQI